MRPRKFRIHFNRINMQRGNPKVWTVHFSNQCIQAEKIVVEGNIETVFAPEARQPRAYFSGRGTATVRGNTVYVRTV